MRSQDEIAQSLIGRQCSNIDRTGPVWTFDFDANVRFVSESPWRIIEAERILVSDEDDGQAFGLEETKSALGIARDSLLGQSVKHVEISKKADFTIVFDTGLSLEIWNNSCGYEAWQIHTSDAQLIGLGGGGIQVIT